MVPPNDGAVPHGRLVAQLYSGQTSGAFGATKASFAATGRRSPYFIIGRWRETLLSCRRAAAGGARRGRRARALALFCCKPAPIGPRV